jgi:hypothetical protein
MVTLKIEQQELELDDALAANDELLRQGLAPFYPFINNALIERKIDKDGQLVIEVVKRAGTKGATSTSLSVLIDTPEAVNPAITLAWQLKQREAIGQIETVNLVQMYEQIDDAISKGREEERLVDAAWSFLSRAAAQTSTLPVEGV